MPITCDQNGPNGLSYQQANMKITLLTSRLQKLCNDVIGFDLQWKLDHPILGVGSPTGPNWRPEGYYAHFRYNTHASLARELLSALKLHNGDEILIDSKEVSLLSEACNQP